MIGRALTRTGRFLVYMIAALLIIVAMLAAFVRVAVLYGDEYRHQLASMVGGYIGSPVEISEIDLLWNRFYASASLTDVRILSDDRSETVLVLPSIEVQLNVRDMLMQRNLSVKSVRLRGLSLVASYDGAGQLNFQGYEISRRTRDSTESDSVATSTRNRGASALNWLFNADRIAILDSAITITDRRSGGEVYKLNDVNIRAFNDGNLHQIRISRSSSSPIFKSEKNIASFDFTGVASDISGWEGRFSIDTDSIDLERIAKVSRMSLDSFDGLANVQLWGSWQGTKINEVRLILAGERIRAATTNTENMRLVAAIESLKIDLDWTRSDDGWRAHFNRFSLHQYGAHRSKSESEDTPVTGTQVGSAEDFHITDSTVDFSGLDVLSGRGESGRHQWRAAGPEISVEQLRSLFPLLEEIIPGPVDFTALQTGTVRNWVAATERDSKGHSRLIALKAEVENFTGKATGHMSGVEGLSADVNYRDGKGRINFGKQTINVALPGLYKTPLPPLDLKGSVQFEVNAEQVSVSSQDLRVGTLDLAVTNAFTLSIKSDGSLPVSLNSKIEHANLARIENYYPERVIQPEFYTWLTEAIVDGDVVRGGVSIVGDLRNFAPQHGNGHLFAEIDIVDSTLNYHPDWPGVNHMDGNISFDGVRLQGRVYQGSVRDAQFSDARVFIADVWRPAVRLTTNAIGPVDDMLGFIQNGPLAKRLSNVVQGSNGEGIARLSLDLNVPLSASAATPLKVDGTIHLKNAQVASNPLGLDLESVSGKVNFNQSGVQIDDLWVRYLGVPVKVQAVQKKRNNGELTRVTARGPVSVSSVLESYGIPLAETFEGLSDWKIDLDIFRSNPDATPEVKLTAISDLSGTAIHLPTPLRKPSDTLLQAVVTRDFSATESDWWVTIPGLVQGRIRTGEDEKLESMAIALGSSANTVLPFRGIAIHGDVGRLDALGWVEFALDIQETADSESTDSFPLFAKLGVRDFLVGKKDLGHAVYIAYRDGEQQIHRLESRYANGEMVQGDESHSEDTLVFKLDSLDRTILSAIGEADSDSEEASIPLDPRELPPLDISIKQLKWDNWRLSRVGLRTQPNEQGLTVKALTARQQSMRLSGNGLWRVDDPTNLALQSTTLDLTATFDDIGRAVVALGGGRAFGGGNGEVALSLAWKAPAYQPDLEILTGQLLLTARDGRLLTVEPGAGKLLGLFALQSLPRRLTLDFRDIVESGLEFTSLSGSFSIANGRALTSGTMLSGPVAEVLIQGETDFVNQLYNQTIDVLPRVSGALPLLGVLSGGPAIGVTAIVADSILKGLGVNLDEIGRRRLTLSGPWEAPKWTPVVLRSKNSSRCESFGDCL